jgi:hypothetical protein
MAECLQKNNKLPLARDLYDFLYDGHKVIEICKAQEITKRNNKNDKEIMDHLTNFMEVGLKYSRYELAMIKAQ